MIIIDKINFMKKQVFIYLMLFILMIGNVMNAQDVTFYGYNNYTAGGNSLGPLFFTSADDLEYITPNTEYISAGEYIAGVWYAYSYSYTELYGSKMPKSFVSINMDTGDMTTIAASSTMVASMSYDPVSNKAYSLSGSVQISTINLETGSLTFQYSITGGPTDYWGIAFNKEGEMYAIGSDSKLYSIDKDTGEATVIGGSAQTGVLSLYTHGLSFDENTGNLYWSLGNGKFCSIDPKTGIATELYNMPNYRIASLIVMPNAAEGAPAKVNNLTATPGASGALSLKLVWDNPSLTAQGETLTSLTTMKIYRHDEEMAIHTINTPTIGATDEEWTDTDIQTAGNYIYTLIGENENGEGAKARISIYVGPDVPKAITNLEAIKNEENVSLSWIAPSEGANGAWFDSSTIKYKVLRQPGDIVMADNLTTTTYMDSGINALELGYYSYSVIPYNNSGDGGVTSTPEILLGEAMIIPWADDFTTSSYLLWSIIDANADNTKWTKYSSSQHMEISASYSRSNDDWMISPPISLEGGKQYQLTWTNRTSTNNMEAQYSVTLGANNTIEGQTMELFPETAIIATTKSYQSVLVTVETEGTYYLGWHCTTPMAKSSLYIDDISLDEPSANDMQAVKVSGNIAPIVNTPAVSLITVKNQGIALASSFDVKLIDGEDNVLGTTTYSGTGLSFGEEAIVKVSWTPAVSGTFAVRGVVDMINDNNVDNNTSLAYSLSVQPEGIISYEVMDEDTTEPWQMIPFNFNAISTASQIVYDAEMLGVTQDELWLSGMFYYFEPLELDYTTSIRILMANTEEDDYESFLPVANLKEVYNTNITFRAGETSVYISFTKPFQYTGGNLVVTNVRGYNTNVREVKFLIAVPEGDETERSLYYSGSSSFNFTQEGMPTTAYPNTTFMAYTTTDNTIKGKVLDAESNPIAGVTVKVDNIETETNEEGEYTLGNTPPFGSVTVAATKIGYVDRTSTITISNKETTVDFTLQARDQVIVTGTVKDQDGEVIEGATVKLTGYQDYETTTNELGEFTLEEVYSSTVYTTLEISMKGYGTYTRTNLSVYVYSGTEYKAGTFTLTAIPTVKVFGKVTNEDGSVYIDNATVKLEGYEDYEVTTSNEGEFEIEGVYVNQDYNIVISAEEYYDYESTLKVEDVDILLEDIILQAIPIKLIVSGKVKSTEGDSLTGASVALVGEDAFHGTTTDTEGAFSISDVLENKEYSLSISAAGYYDYQTTVQLLESNLDLGNIELTWIPTTVIVSGKVISDKGVYLSEASVKLSEGGIIYEEATDTSGSFEMFDIPMNKTYNLEVSLEGFDTHTSSLSVNDLDIVLEDIVLIESLGLNHADISEIKVYPNPAVDYVHVELTSNSIVSIYTLGGEKVYTNRYEVGVAEINVKMFDAGIYLVEINDDTNKVIIKLIIK
jgi:hypothetical protein